MKGTITHISIEQQTGLIQADDQQHYEFSANEWRSPTPPEVGQFVDFVTDAEGKATAVYLNTHPTNSNYATSPPFHNTQTHNDTASAEEDSYGMLDWFVKCVTSHYFNFSGRARRKEFWFFMLFCFIIGIFTSIIDAVLDSQWVSSIVNLALFIPSLAVGARRLHDIGRSGWWQLLFFTVIGIFLLIIWWVLDSDKYNNRFGQPPY